MIRVLRFVIVMGTAAVLVLTALVALGRLYRFEAARGAATAGGSDLAAAADGTGRRFDAAGAGAAPGPVACEAVAGVEGRFRLTMAGPDDPLADVVAAVDLLDRDGRRHRRVVPLVGADGGGREAVADGPPGTVRCAVAAYQIGDRVVGTSR